MKYRVVAIVILALVVFGGCERPEAPDNANWWIYYHQGYMHESYYAIEYEVFGDNIIVTRADGGIEVYTPCARWATTFRATPLKEGW